MPTETAPISIYDPASIGLTGKQVKTVFNTLSMGMRMTLAEIKEHMKSRGVEASEAGISARIRDINKAFRLNGRKYHITHRPYKKGSNLMIYWIEGAQS